ncbi:MAG: VOC family protein [Gammaproteobacteria bacterium]|nr:VOC family protein [Gammaproteobacteria bacterium]
MKLPLTAGTHHIGLTVSKLEETASFFTELLGWHEVRRDPDYPAVFISDGNIMVSLWQINDPENAPPFDFKHKPGLHHVALKVENQQALTRIHQIISHAKDINIEFAPELLRHGPAMHMMCTEPSGLRVEFIWPGN